MIFFFTTNACDGFDKYEVCKYKYKYKKRAMLFATSLSGLPASQTYVNASDIHSIIQQTVLFLYQIWGGV